VFLQFRKGLEIELQSHHLHPTLDLHFGKYRILVPGWPCCAT